MKTVWLISDGNPGHYNQSKAIAEIIGEVKGWAVHWITVKPRYRGFMRPTVRLMTERLGGLMGLGAGRVLFTIDTLPDEPPGFVLSSGGKTAVFNALIARHFSCANLFIGLPPISPALFSRILLIESHFTCDNCQSLDFLPTPVSAEGAKRAGDAFRQKNGLKGRYWSLLIGGNSRSHKYSAEEWQQLAQTMNKLALENEIQWLVTSSRRTGLEAENVLQDHLKPELVGHATWWGSAPAKVVKPYLGASDVVFCTQDSLTMLTDGMGAGKPVIALGPQHVVVDEVRDRFFLDYIQRNIDKNRIKRIMLDELNDLGSEMLTGFETLQGSVAQEIYQSGLKDLLEPV
ncbi:MAG: mitochondrial fission ELM1 family protein [Magnetococcales bacterium]|nr:mitochondrial fission ELM1 family protein [Magnetococcales bacterium]